MLKPAELAIVPMDAIRAMGQLIASQFQPDKIILFGSYARGDANIHSDIDLMVVMQSDLPWFRQSTPMRLALSRHWTEPIEIVVRSPEAYGRHRRQPFTLESEADREGLVLYEKRV